MRFGHSGGGREPSPRIFTESRRSHEDIPLALYVKVTVADLHPFWFVLLLIIPTCGQEEDAFPAPDSVTVLFAGTRI